MEDELKIQEKSVVVPGETLAIGMGFLPSFGTYREGDRILANRVGLVAMDGKVIKLIPLSGVYLPKIGDVIVAQVIDVLMTGWRVDTYTPYSAVLTIAEATSDFIPKKADLTKWFDIGDFVLTKVSNVTSQNLVDISMRGPGLRKLKNGRLLKVCPQKIPRIIGKKGSMISIIKLNTGCRISAGQNGIIWIEGEPERVLIAVTAINKIVAESHISGLTEKMKQWLEVQTKDLPKIEVPDDYPMYDEEHHEHREHSGHRDFHEHRGPREHREPRGHFSDRGYPPRERREFTPREHSAPHEHSVPRENLAPREHSVPRENSEAPRENSEAPHMTELEHRTHRQSSNAMRFGARRRRSE